MKKLLKKFATGVYDYEIRYADYNERRKKQVVPTGFKGKTITFDAYDGAVWFERKMGTLNWSVDFDKVLIDKVKKKFRLSQMTWNWYHNGFSADYVTRKEGIKIAEYLYRQLKYYYYTKEN